MGKVIIVEGKTDGERLRQVLAEQVDIVVTYGTLGYQRLNELIDKLQDADVYILTDADESGEKLRRQLKKEFPNATHLYALREFGQVANTPLKHLSEIFQEAKFLVKQS
ncbi:toprim domain-containing protein [Desulforamulus aquiferis]|uniref:Toprim domain-containing protein n=1 Tax=Desulforamulus aquiferis TaxID=1397668 RepID=A0AAW7ZC47_9FIRM|nr:toprim domain-containing protein [Desulforamulus aquiferis]MDO7786681.1 toprim domain-containing protein [Desulforamulus aquiferis]